jgi:hypothetical protein
VIGAEAVITEPSGALSVYQTGEEVWEYPKEVTKKESPKKRAAKRATENLRTDTCLSQGSK